MAAIEINLNDLSPANKEKVQQTFFDVVGGALGLADYTEITDTHVRDYLVSHVKQLARNYFTEDNRRTFESGYTDPI